MSKNIVDSIILYCNKTETPLTFIPSRRQIEFNGGYVNNWTTESFTKYVKSRSNIIAIQRDHAGPGQGKLDDNGYESLKHDCQHFDAIHIDPWKKYPFYSDAVKWTIDMIRYCHNINPKIYFEIGTEEAIRKIKNEELNLFIKDVKANLTDTQFSKILFCVIQSGTSLCNGVNTGNYSDNKLIEMIKTVKSHNLLSKEHNGDYMDKKDMKNRFENKLDSINIAPEFGVLETTFILEQLIKNDMNDEINEFYKLCYESGKWKKWVDSDFNINNKNELIKICGHYVFTNPKFKKIKNKLSEIDKKIIQFLFKKLTFFYSI